MRDPVTFVVACVLFAASGFVLVRTLRRGRRTGRRVGRANFVLFGLTALMFVALVFLTV